MLVRNFRILIFFLLSLVVNSCCSSSLSPENAFLENLQGGEDFALFGHKNPDLDSYGSAYAYAYLLKKLGVKAKAYALGSPNLETQFVLKHLKLEPLPVLKKLPRGTKAILLDHNEKRQSVPGLEEEAIAQIIDHHRIDLKTPDTPSIQIERVGSTATLIYGKYRRSFVTLDAIPATFLLAAILSDTNLLTSPTTTDLDREACKKLSWHAKLDYKEFGEKLLLAGTKTEHISASELYHSDMKLYEFMEDKASIGVINTRDIAKTLKRRKEFVSYMEEFREEEKLSFSVLLLTDVAKKNSHAIIVGHKKRFDKAFSGKKKGKDYFLKGVVSRKRQVVPRLEKSI